MKSLLKLYCVGSAFLVALFAGQTASAWTIYNNTTGDLSSGYSSTNEFGDQVVFNVGGPRIVTNFTFEFFGVGVNPGGESTLTVRFYLNDGPGGYATPGTLLWTSDPFSVSGTDRATISYQPNVFIGKSGVPYDEFTWTVQFTDPTGGGTWGLDMYDPPTVGYNYDDYWEHDALGEWLLKTNRFSVPMNFAARIEAVPEPNAMVLGIAGALAILLFRASIRRV
jgi:hypothetical protein